MPRKTTTSSKRHRADATYNRYIGAILKKTHRDIGMSRGAVGMINTVAEDLVLRLVSGSSKVAITSKKSTLGAQHVKAAAKVMLPCELARLATENGISAVTKYKDA
jgi:histone H3/H4